jgi:hypothetical protein
VADFNSSLTVRTQSNGDVVAFLADGTTSTQLLAISPSGALTLTSTGSASGGTAATVSQLAGAIFNTVLPTLTTGEQAALQVDSSGRLIVDIGTVSGGSIPVTQSTTPWVTSDLADGSVSGGLAGTKSLLAGAVFNSSALALTTGEQASLQIDALGNLLVKLNTSLPSGVNSIGSVAQGLPNTIANAWPIEITNGTSTAFVAPASTAAAAANPALVVALSPNSPIPAGTAAIGSVLANLQVANAAVTVSNPVPVTITSASSGTPIQNFQTSTALAAGASVTLTYTVPATHTFSLERIWASSEARISAAVSINGTASYMAFNSSAFPNIDLTVTAPPTLAAASTVAVTFTNNDKGASNVYLTVEGNQIS